MMGFLWMWFAFDRRCRDVARRALLFQSFCLVSLSNRHPTSSLPLYVVSVFASDHHSQQRGIAFLFGKKFCLRPATNVRCQSFHQPPPRPLSEEHAISP
jgi:hypothetical protein